MTALDLLKKWRAEIAADATRPLFTWRMADPKNRSEYRFALDLLSEAYDDENPRGHLTQADRLRIYDSAIARLGKGT